MNLQEQLKLLQEDYQLTYKEARFKLKAHLRKLYEDGIIDHRTWKESKKLMEKELQ